MDDPISPIGFRRLAAADLPRLHRWLNAPHVARWYRGEGTPEEIRARYAEKAAGTSPTAAYVILVGGEPVGYIQTYLVCGWPEYARQVEVDTAAAGLDLFIGEGAYVHRGLGPLIIRQFLREVVFADPEIESCVIGPEVGNRAAIGAYEKAGFRYLKTVHVSGEPEPEYLMRITREEFAASSP